MHGYVSREVDHACHAYRLGARLRRINDELNGPMLAPSLNKETVEPTSPLLEELSKQQSRVSDYLCVLSEQIDRLENMLGMQQNEPAPIYGLKAY